MTRLSSPSAAWSIGLAAVLLILSACGGRREQTAPVSGESANPAAGATGATGVTGAEGAEGAAGATPNAVATPEADATPQAPATTDLSLLFPGTGDDFLHIEKRSVIPLGPPAEQAKLVLSELFKGPGGGLLRVLPDGAQVRQIYVLADGTAWADLTAEVLKIGGGSTDEALAVYSIVDTLALNVPDIKRVGILVNGQTRPTLAGHVDLQRPLPPDYSYLQEAARPAPPPGTEAAGSAADDAHGTALVPEGGVAADQSADATGQGSAGQGESEGMAPPPPEEDEDRKKPAPKGGKP